MTSNVIYLLFKVESKGLWQEQSIYVSSHRTEEGAKLEAIRRIDMWYGRNVQIEWRNRYNRAGVGCYVDFHHEYEILREEVRA